MIVVVDTSVWIDFFGGRSARHVETLERLLTAGDDVCLCGVILAEVLQGIRSEIDYRKTKAYFESLLYLPMDRRTFERAAEIYRSLRKKGMTVRKPVDCMIASVAIEQDIPLLHSDRDFDPIERHCGLEVLRVPNGPIAGRRGP
jgi:predicted nucleic acid-binding protein